MLVAVLKILVTLLPLLVFAGLGFKRWRRHYGGGTFLGYFMRYATQKRATDDRFPIYAAKLAVFLLWFVISTSVLF